MSKKPSLADRLAKAAEGVMLPSEFDSPFTVAHWPNAEFPKTPSAFRKLVGVAPQSSVEAFDVAALLSRLGADQSTDGADVRKMKVKFRKLAAFLKEQFEELAGFRAGNINVETYIVGRTSADEVFALKASGVET